MHVPTIASCLAPWPRRSMKKLSNRPGVVRTNTCAMAIGGNGTADTSVCRSAPATVTVAPPASPPTALGHHVLVRSLILPIVPQAGHSGGVPDPFSRRVSTMLTPKTWGFVVKVLTGPVGRTSGRASRTSVASVGPPRVLTRSYIRRHAVVAGLARDRAHGGGRGVDLPGDRRAEGQLYDRRGFLGVDRRSLRDGRPCDAGSGTSPSWPLAAFLLPPPDPRGLWWGRPRN